MGISTAGNQISFLVPVDKLMALLEKFSTKKQNSIHQKEKLKTTIHQNLMKNKKNIIDTILAAKWQLRSLGEAMVIGKIVSSIKCWGNSKKSESSPLIQIIKGCSGQDLVYLSQSFNTGMVEYEFIWPQAKDLSSARFYNAYQRQMNSFYAGNNAGSDDVTNFRCQQKFIQQQRLEQTLLEVELKNQGKTNVTHNREPVIARTTYCVRRYREFQDLYDIFYLSLTVDQKDRALVSHFTLSGFTQNSAIAFSKKFVSEIQWH